MQIVNVLNILDDSYNSSISGPLPQRDEVFRQDLLLFGHDQAAVRASRGLLRRASAERSVLCHRRPVGRGVLRAAAKCGASQYFDPGDSRITTC